MSTFRKVICPEFDRIEIEGDRNTEWLTLTMTPGYTCRPVGITLRSTEAVRDLHYALGRYLATVDGGAQE